MVLLVTANKKPLDEEVPGMADAIETRRKALGMPPGAFAEAAGVTPQGLVPVRKGYRRQYQDKLKLGAARALQWPPDAIDRLMAGEDPATFTDPGTASPSGAGIGDEAGGVEGEAEMARLVAKLGKLPPPARARLVGYVDALFDDLDEQDR